MRSESGEAEKNRFVILHKVDDILNSLALDLNISAFLEGQCRVIRPALR